MIHIHAFNTLAHAGHSGPETTSLLTHLVLGLLIALPLSFGILRAATRRKQDAILIKPSR